MDFTFSTFGNWGKKVLFDVEMLEYYEEEFNFINRLNEYTFYFLHRNDFISLFKHNILNRVTHWELDKTYKTSVTLKEYYSHLLDFCRGHSIDVIFFTSTWQYWHPEFLQKLKDLGIVLALSTADDDTDTINYCSLPYTRYYDYHFHVGVMFDANTTIAQKLREYGSKCPIWVPLWARAGHINENVSFMSRDIELCYIGNMNPQKFLRISKLKRHFKDRLKLYGSQWNGDWKTLKWIFYKICNKIFQLWYIEKISDSQLLNIYKRTKIGFNLHLVPIKWPSNSRMYELPCNGVMQLCDNQIWLAKIFDLWKEVVWYKNINDAIQKIEYYLSHESERIEIAKSGYKKAINNYRYRDSLETMLHMSLNWVNTNIKK